MKIVEIGPEQIEEDCQLLADKIPIGEYSHLYPVLRGGAVPTSILSRITGLPIIKEPIQNTLIVDDVVDSGATREKFINFPFAALHVKSTTPSNLFPTYYARKQDGWLAYWWEGGAEGIEVQEQVTRILEYIGEDPNREGLVETPERVVRSWHELYSGYELQPGDVFKDFDADGCDEMVLLRDIEVYSTCEHHMLPFFGKAHVAYIPDKRVIGVSKLARLLDIFSRRLQIQERIGEQVTKCLMEYLKPKGAACIIEAEHFCMRSRGVGKQNSVMITSSLKGVFIEKPEARAELMRLIR